MRAGQKVKFVNPSEDETFPMFIVWADRERCMVVTDIGWGNLNPTSVVMTEEICAC